MIIKINRNQWKVLVALAMVSIAIPLAIVTYELIFKGKETVVFFEDSNPLLAILMLTYYGLLFILGLSWLVMQIVDVMKLRNEKVKNELTHLQSQINPHFFFNVLNNLYGLVGKDADKAQQLILKLSDMMRYSIYDGQKECVTIAEEVAYLKNFIELHKMRYHKKIEIKFDIKTADENRKIKPLLFIILLENAFKHGVEHLRDNAYVHVKLFATTDKLNFEVRNNFEEDEVGEEKGVGLMNLKRRLELVYPHQHVLSFSKTDNVYQAQLSINNYDQVFNY